MKKLYNVKKTDKNADLSLNQGKSVRYRKRLQETKEKEQELREYAKDNRVYPLD
mgnify:CR=1 FL=1